MRDAVKEIYDQIKTLDDLFELIPELDPDRPYPLTDFDEQFWEEDWQEALPEILEQFIH